MERAASTVTRVLVDPNLFDLKMLSRRIDDACKERGITLASLAPEVGVSASTIRRYHTASDAEADGVLALIAWLGDPPEHFITDSSIVGIPLPDPGSGQIRVDMTLIAEAGFGTPSATRTTIQRLDSAAHESGRTVASLTRITPC